MEYGEYVHYMETLRVQIALGFHREYVVQCLNAQKSSNVTINEKAKIVLLEEGDIAAKKTDT